MSIRITALIIFLIFLWIYVWKDWFISLCGLILLMAVIEYPDMPKSIFGIPGLNLWNITLGITLIAWMMSNHRQKFRWDMPRNVAILLLIYLGVIIIGVMRLCLNPTYIWSPLGLAGVIFENLLNTIKWTIPALLLFDGCRTHRQVVLAYISIIALLFLLAVQVIKWIPIEGALGSASDTTDNKRMKLNKEIGYHNTDVAVLLAGAFWGIIASLHLTHKKKYKALFLAASIVVAFALALTGGRGGYIAWVTTGLILCLIKWTKHLIIAPVVVLLLPVIFPGVTARMFIGFGQTDISGQSTIDTEALTSGRIHMWPHVINKIGESPLVGFGREAMRRTGLVRKVELEFPGTGGTHPHNMYLETLLDNGILGSIPIFVFWGILVVYAGRSFRSKNRLCSSVGGLALALTLSSLIGGITGQHFYPQEHTISIWAAQLLALRVYVEEKRAQIDRINVNTSPTYTHQQPEIISSYS
jgi:O-antigen ligase